MILKALDRRKWLLKVSGKWKVLLQLPVKGNTSLSDFIPFAPSWGKNFGDVEDVAAAASSTSSSLATVSVTWRPARQVVFIC